MTLPSIKLIESVFGITVTTEISIQNAYDEMNGIELEWQELYFNYMSYPLDFVARKCKEWALSKNYEIESSLFVDCNKERIGYSQVLIEEAPMYQRTSDTEHEAIFKACEWILEQRNSK